MASIIIYHPMKNILSFIAMINMKLFYGESVLDACVKSRLCVLISYICLMFEFFHIINLDMLVSHKTVIKFIPCNQYIFHTYII